MFNSVHHLKGSKTRRPPWCWTLSFLSLPVNWLCWPVLLLGDRRFSAMRYVSDMVHFHETLMTAALGQLSSCHVNLTINYFCFLTWKNMIGSYMLLHKSDVFLCTSYLEIWLELLQKHYITYCITSSESNRKSSTLNQLNNKWMQ